MWNTTIIFSNKNHGLQKKTLQKILFFEVGYAKIIELHILPTWRHMQFD